VMGWGGVHALEAGGWAREFAFGGKVAELCGGKVRFLGSTALCLGPRILWFFVRLANWGVDGCSQVGIMYMHTVYPCVAGRLCESLGAWVRSSDVRPWT
jgi:hypothetical protein